MASMLEVLKIIFWVTVVETVLGHLPWVAPVLVFGIAMVVGLLQDNKKKKDDEELDEKIKKIDSRRRK